MEQDLSGAGSSLPAPLGPVTRALTGTFLSDLSPPHSSKKQIPPEHFLPALPALLPALSIQPCLVGPCQGVQAPALPATITVTAVALAC